MLNIKNLTPYLLTLLLIIISLQFLASMNNSFIKTIFKEIDYLVTDENVINDADFMEVDYSIFSNEMICDKVPHIDFYPELSGFLDEANRRGIKCYYKTVGYYSTNNSENFVSDIDLPVSKPKGNS